MILFDGAQSEDVTTVSSWTPPSPSATISFWMYYTQSDYDWIWEHDSGNFARLNGTSLEIALCRQANKNFFYAAGFVTNTVYHILSTSYTLSGKQGMDLWLNGTKVLTGDSANAGTPTSATTCFGSAHGTNYFYGALMDMRWYNRVLTDDEAQAIWAMRGRDEIWQGLLHRWPFTGGPDGTSVSGTGVVRDWVGEIHATPANTPTWEVDNPLAWRKIA